MYLDGMLTLVQIGILTFMLNRITLSTMMLHGLSWNPMKNAIIPHVCLTIMVPVLVLKDIWIHPFLRWQEVRTNEAKKFQRENNTHKCKEKGMNSEEWRSSCFVNISAP